MIPKKISTFQKRNSVRRAGLLICLMSNKKRQIRKSKDFLYCKERREILCCQYNCLCYFTAADLEKLVLFLRRDLSSKK
jgi:hypothetical protein